MRPRELTVRGFRSYRDRTTFDWRDRRLVGVVGPIGAGKSSILDAIAFALYGKTPTFERDTKSLIHQLADECHVELVFEVDGQTWRVQRALRRKGASGHKLERLAADEPDAEVIESVQLEGPVNKRIAQLLGMEFDAFCRSVLLAQNRFSEFLKATKGQRNEVLKGVFGYERFDAAHAVAKDRARGAELELEALTEESDRLLRATEELAEAEEVLASTTARHDELDAARPRIESLAAARAAALAAAEAAQTRSGDLQKVVRSLPAEDHLDAVVTDASVADRAVAQAEEAIAESTAVLAGAEAARDALAQREGDQAALLAFAALVERHDHEAQAAGDAATRHEAGSLALADARERAETLAADTREAAARLEAAEATLASASRGAGEAEAAMHDAQHADMAHELRRSLTAGEACPVCRQVVTALPAAGRAPALTRAERALAAARAAEASARDERDTHAARHAAAGEKSASLAAQLVTLEAGATSAEAARRGAEAALAATKSELVDRLGEGDPRALLAERQREVAEAEAGVKEAGAGRDQAVAARDEAHRRATTATHEVAALAAQLAGAWGRVGETRVVTPEPEGVRLAYADLGETLLARLEEVAKAAQAAVDAAGDTESALVAEATAMGLGPHADLTLALAGAAAAQGAATQRVRSLQETLARGADLQGQLAGADRRRSLAKRLASDLQPSRFLAYLLEEERAALAELGSVHFEELTGGAYRYSEDDSFDVVDVNAGGAVRTADSLSGGETFLASLALALALAEMVARGGGRLDAFFLDEGFGSLDPEHLERAMDGIGRLVAGDTGRLVVLVSHVEQMRQLLEDLIVLDKDARTGNTRVVSGASRDA